MARQKQLVRSGMKSLSDTRGDWAKENTQTRTFMSANTQVPTRPRPPSLCITVFMLQSYGFAGKYDPLRHVRICVCVSLRASVFRLSEELCYRQCFFCQISFARTKQRSYDPCLASRLHIQFI